MYKIIFILIGFLSCNYGLVNAQTPIKEAMNSFASYTATAEFSQLEKAKKFIDDAYKTKRDSFTFKNNLVRCMVYATLANRDINRKLSYVKEPIAEAAFALNRLLPAKLSETYFAEITYCKKQLAQAYLVRANSDLAATQYYSAYDDYLWVDSLNPDNIMVRHNLAVLSEQLGYRDKAIEFYQDLIANAKSRMAEYYIVLSNLYDQKGDADHSLSILQKGTVIYPKNRDILFKQINILSDNKKYSAITTLIDNALNLQPDNIQLYYLAGFSQAYLGNLNLAERYYKKIIALDPYNYEGNYALGLLYLNQYQKNAVKKELLQNAKLYLKTAGEINPNSINVLKMQAAIYQEVGEKNLLKQTRNKLNQIKLN